ASAADSRSGSAPPGPFPGATRETSCRARLREMPSARAIPVAPRPRGSGDSAGGRPGTRPARGSPDPPMPEGSGRPEMASPPAVSVRASAGSAARGSQSGPDRPWCELLFAHPLLLALGRLAARHLQDHLEQPAPDAFNRLAFEDRTCIEIHVV